MKFSKTKLPAEAIKNLRKIPVRLFKPYDLVAAPIYVFLLKNQKFVAVKAPLNFFNLDELNKLSFYQDFYTTEFIECIRPFSEAAQAICSIIQKQEILNVKTNQGPIEIKLPCAQFYLDDAVLRVLGSLWGTDGYVEPYFTAFFANEVCKPFETQFLSHCYEKNVQLFELGLLRAGAAVFLAMHLGFYNRDELTIIRNKIILDTVDERQDGTVLNEFDQIKTHSKKLIQNSNVKRVQLTDLEKFQDKVSKKIISRLNRIKKELLNQNKPSQSIFGEKGFCDEG